MYIAKIELHNIRCFEDAILNFEDENGNCRDGVILGNNGHGKTTLLRSIAMSLSGEASAQGLLDDIEGDWIRNDADEGYIRLTLKSIQEQKEYLISTDFIKESGNADIVEKQTVTPNDNGFQPEKYLFCGYGASRGISGDTLYEKYAVVDAMYTLFSMESGYLQNPELVIRRIKDTDDNKETLNKVLNWISTILMLPPESLQLNLNGLYLNNLWEQAMTIGALADGHRATLTMICDLLGWAFLHDSTIFKKEISGIVLIDEIEQHLHPKWQRKIVGLLKKIFPKIQFIVTTHSPLIAGNAGILFGDSKESKLFIAVRDKNKSKISEIEENLSELDCNQILSSEAFGYISNQNSKVESTLREASMLAAKNNRTDVENQKFEEFKKKLKQLMFPKGKTLIERVIEREYYKELEKKIKEFENILKVDLNNDKN